MRILSNRLKILSALFLTGAALIVRADSLSSDLQALVESEKTFARTTSERGINDSFLQFLADDSVVFVPGPTNGKAAYAKYEEKGRKLAWQPIFATISAAADLGITTGPWQLSKSAAEPTPVAFGEFVSIWKKQADGGWKVVLDFGIDHPKPAKAVAEVQLSPPNATPSGASQLAQKEGIFERALRTNAGPAVLDAASHDVRVFREDSFPAVGADAAKALLDADHSKITRNSAGSGISASSDLAYRYGAYSSERGTVLESGYYLTVWQIDRAGVWKIILDLQKKIPTGTN
ncbi:MAG: hypothetical protein QOI34_1530 [Verrucomicrobiota bacterium]